MSYGSCYPCSAVQTPKAASELMSPGLAAVSPLCGDILEIPSLPCAVPGFCQIVLFLIAVCNHLKNHHNAVCTTVMFCKT